MTDSPPPLTADLVDELLSAELDGEFDAAATDAGFTPDEARTRLDATPGVEARRFALAATGGALAVSPLSAALRDRLVATAIAAATSDELAARRTRRRLPVFIGSVAAALLLVVGAVATVANLDSTDNDTTSVADAAAPSASTERFDAGGNAAEMDASAPAPATLSFGTIADAEALRVAVDQQLQLDERDDATMDGAIPDSSSKVVPSTEPSLLTGVAGSADQQVACATARADAFSIAPPMLVLVGSATYAGIAATVYVYAEPDNYLVVVAADADCSLLVSQYLSREP